MGKLDRFLFGFTGVVFVIAGASLSWGMPGAFFVIGVILLYLFFYWEKVNA